MYLNTFRYTPEMVDCKLCTEYKKGCTTQGSCPWLAERIEAGVVGYSEAVTGIFPHRPGLQARLTMAEQLFNGSLGQMSSTSSVGITLWLALSIA